MELNLRVMDVSAYTPLTRVPWSDSRIAAGYVKLSEGVTIFDRLAGAHLYNLSQAKKPAGIYHFFHPSHSAQEQFDWIVKCSEQTCWGKVGDLVPGIDLERNVTDGMPTSSWNEPAEVLYNLLTVRFGGCLVYCGQATFADMGKPQWLVECKQWVPQWSRDGYPVIAPYFVKGLGNAQPVMVQNYVGPLFASIQESAAPNAVDQNYASELIAITGGIAISEHPPLTIGSTGPEVALWQQIVKVKVDGIFGPQSSEGAKKWQTANDLPVTGCVGTTDWTHAFADNGWLTSEGVKGAARVDFTDIV